MPCLMHRIESFLHVHPAALQSYDSVQVTDTDLGRIHPADILANDTLFLRTSP